MRLFRALSPFETGAQSGGLAGVRDSPGAPDRDGPGPLVTIGPEGRINDVNEATVKATGVPRDELAGSDFCDYFTDPPVVSSRSWMDQRTHQIALVHATSP